MIAMATWQLLSIMTPRPYNNIHTYKKITLLSTRVTGATSFKEGYFFGAFSILPDTSFLLWTKIYFFGNKTMKFDLFPLFWDQNTVFYRKKIPKK